jgi:O-antigen/teichoic acid export membrane protein
VSFVERLKSKSRGLAIVTKGAGRLNGLTALFDQGIVSLTNFLTVILLAKYCSDSVFTAIALSGQVINYMRSAQERMISAPYGAFCHRDDVELTTLTGSSLWQSFVFLVVMTSTATIASISFLCTGINPGMATGLLAQCLLLPCLLGRDHLRSICFSRMQVPFAFGIDFVSSLAQLGGVWLMIQAEQTDSVSISFLLALANVIPVLIWFSWKPIPYKIDRARVAIDWSQSWDYSRWLLVGRMMGVAAYLIVPWLLAIQYGDAETALFAKAFNIVGVSNLLVAGLNNYFLPLTVRAYHQGGRQSLIQKLLLNGAIYFVGLGALSLVYMLWGDGLMNLVYKTTHEDQGTVIVILGFNVMAFSLAIVAGNGFAALQSSLSNLWGEIGNFIVSMIAAAVLIPAYGLLGAAAAIALGSTASMVIASGMLVRALRREAEEPKGGTT